MPAHTVNRRLILYVLGIMLAAGLAYRSSIQLFFCQDDFIFLQRAAKAHSFIDAARLFVAQDHFFRPLPRVLILGLEWHMFGMRPAWYHLVNVGFHAINAVLTFILALRFYRRPGPAAAAGLIYALHPIAFLAVYWVSGIQELSLVTFVLLTVILFDEWYVTNRPLWFILSLFTCVLALLSKEPAVVLPALVVIWAVCRSKSGLGKVRWKPLLMLAAAYSLMVVMYLVIRTLRTPPLSASGAYAMALSLKTIVNNVTAYLGELLCIRQWVDSHWGSAWPLVIVCAAGLTALTVLAGRSRWGILMGAAWFVTAILPVVSLSNRAFGYYAYLALAGACVSVAGLVSSLAGAAETAVSTVLVRGSPPRPLVLMTKWIVIAGLVFAWVLVSRGSFSRLDKQELDPDGLFSKTFEAARAAARVTTAYPELGEQDLLLITDVGETENWAYGFGDMFRLYYPSTRVVIVPMGQSLPADIDPNGANVHIISARD